MYSVVLFCTGLILKLEAGAIHKMSRATKNPRRDVGTNQGRGCGRCKKLFKDSNHRRSPEMAGVRYCPEIDGGERTKDRPVNLQG